MKRLTFADKSLLTGDAMADAVLEYAALLANAGDARPVELSAYGASGEKVTATLLLGAGAPVMVETTGTDFPEPDNGLALDMILGEIRLRLDPPSARMVDGPPAGDEDDAYTG
ncbi:MULTISPECIES: hypothetical protein [unclassified Microbacterium]|uniref:hypothetical protein n=1 Tax=unclassified Microbacterium TaxID=2609290 RepID=UPI00214CFFA5|nr:MULTISPECIES: hypothetical protein [unclassified Microbacterium]MCR2799891.1 hypothetical protein [Microbacterium sp. zg.Y818]MCR2825608.1 hypothetical protein [Microbacterium sp. zg.Y909]WIM21873.1 hypothetical protein QNO21_12235 [Microbacterium sp. zg-Y818]